MEAALGELDDVRIVVFEPGGGPVDGRANRSRDVPEMTAGRAALVGLLHRYLGGLLDPFVTLLEAHKLSNGDHSPGRAGGDAGIGSGSGSGSCSWTPNEPTPPQSEMQWASSMTSRLMRPATSAGTSTAPVGRRSGPTGLTRRADGRRNRRAPRIAYHAPATTGGEGRDR